MTQLDSNFPPGGCHYPQMSELEQIHDDAPNATFVLNFRPMKDWYKSVQHWGTLKRRLQQCDLPNFPTGKGKNVTEFSEWFCGHVKIYSELCTTTSHACLG